MRFLEQEPLSKHATFRLGGPARFFAIATSVEELGEAIAFARSKNLPWLILGGGSNILFPDDGYPGVIIKLSIIGVSVSRQENKEAGGKKNETRGETLISAGAGEEWDPLVALSVSLNLRGLENLSLIPGNVGGSAVQNIGAYGTEASTCIRSVEVFDARSMLPVTLAPEECHFGYRHSIFKEVPELVVTRVTYALSESRPFELSYPDLRQELSNNHFPALKDVRDAVIAIRRRKLPDPAEIGTAGSFFKNPIIAGDALAALRLLAPEVPVISLGGGAFKIPAAWLLDRLGGFKGVRRGAVGTHGTQALVIVHHGGGTSRETLAFAREMREKIWNIAHILLEPEVVTPCTRWSEIQNASELSTHAAESH